MPGLIKNRTTDNKNFEFYIACRHDKLDLARQIWKEGSVDPSAFYGKLFHPMHDAIYNAPLKMVEFLLNLGVDPDAKSQGYGSALMMTLTHSREDSHEKTLKIVEALERKYSDDPEALLKSLTGGDYISGRSEEMASALKEASIETLQFLEAKIADAETHFDAYWFTNEFRKLKAPGTMSKPSEAGTEEILDVMPNEIEESIDHKKIAIIGGGASGTAMAINLLSKADEMGAVEIVLIEKEEAKRAGGLAYSFSKAGNEHVINVHAEHMSILPEDNRDFIRWLRRQNSEAGSGTSEYEENFDAVPRSSYQKYLKQRLHEAIEDAQDHNPDLIVTKKNGKVVDLDEYDDGAVLYFEDDSMMEAEHVVLATGHTNTVIPEFCKDVSGSYRFLGSQWGNTGRQFMDDLDKKETVFIVGTSMSAFDAIVSLQERGHEGQIVMMSRNANLHSTYRKGEQPSERYSKAPSFISEIKTPVNIAEGQSKEAAILDRFENSVREEWSHLTNEYGHTGQEITSAWEAHLPNAIKTLSEAGVSEESMASLLNKHKSAIYTNRIGVSWAIGDVVNQAINDGQVKVWAGNIKGMQEGSNGITVHCDLKLENGETVGYEHTFDRVISSLGQETNYKNVKDPLWKSLVDQGLVTSHWTGVGIEVSKNGRVCDEDGHKSEIITAVGAMRAGDTMVRERAHRDNYGVDGGRLGPISAAVRGIRDTIDDTADNVIKQVNTLTHDHVIVEHSYEESLNI